MIRKLLFTLATISLTSPLWSATPTLVQHYATDGHTSSSDAGVGHSSFTFNMPNLTLSGNAMILALLHDSAVTTSSVADDKGNFWKLAQKVSDAGPQESLEIWISTNIVAGTLKLTITFSGASQIAKFHASEWYNVGTSTDGASSNNGSTLPNLTSGSFTTGTSGDLIYAFCNDSAFTNLGSNNAVTGFTAGSNFTLLSADRWQVSGAEFQVQSAAGAINPGITISGPTDSGLCAAIALKSASAGTAPAAGIRIIGISKQFPDGQPSTSFWSFNFPTFGNMISWDTEYSSGTGGQMPLATINDSKGNAYTLIWPGGAADSGGQFAYTQGGATTDPTLVITTTFTVNTIQNGFFTGYDITGAATSPFDTSVAQASGANGTGPFTATPAPTITPGTSNGLVIAEINLGVGPSTATTVGTFEDVNYAVKTDGGMDSGDGHAHFYNPNTNAETWSWSVDNQAQVSGWIGSAFTIKAAPVGGSTSSSYKIKKIERLEE